jgi:RNA polymerase sigma-70 factor (ECF subfamily)
MSSNAPWSWERYRGVLLLVARRLLRELPQLRRRVDSEDLVQQAMLKAETARQQFRGETPEEWCGWVRVILRHVCLDVLAHETAQQRDVTLDRALEEAVHRSSVGLAAVLAASQDSTSESAGRVLDVADALARLPEDLREVVIAHDIDGESLRQVAARLGVSKNTVARRLDEGQAQLAQLLESYREDGHG